MLKGRGIRKVEKHCVKTVCRVLVRECPHWREKREPGQEGGWGRGGGGGSPQQAQCQEAAETPS